MAAIIDTIISCLSLIDVLNLVARLTGIHVTSKVQVYVQCEFKNGNPDSIPNLSNSK